MNEERFLLAMAVVAVGVSVIAAGLTYFTVANFVTTISGFATTGEANLTVESQAVVNFTTSLVTWGSGRVSGGAVAALTTYKANNVTNGNWTLETAGGLRVENAGNVNVTLNLSGSKTAAAFIGGTGPVYRWNVTAVEANSCLNVSGTGASGIEQHPLNREDAVNTSVATSAMFCPVFRFQAANDLIRIDFNLTIPEDSITGILTDTITATAVSDNPPI